jgi:hypothetical protein
LGFDARTGLPATTYSAGIRHSGGRPAQIDVMDGSPDKTA